LRCRKVLREFWVPRGLVEVYLREIVLRLNHFLLQFWPHVNPLLCNDALNGLGWAVAVKDEGG
jgi:hypothetical protein